MELAINDLKVKRASVYVSNEEAEVKDYVIGASFVTNKGKLSRIEGGNVTKDNINLASFYTGYDMEQSITITYYGEASTSHELQCAINKLINDFVELAAAKAIEEISE